jgi:hypothetical protein
VVKAIRCVYALCEPLSPDCVRYVGKAENLQRRIANHLIPSNLRRKRHVTVWLASLVKQGLRPVVKVLQEIDSGDMDEAERFWIAEMRAAGFDLTNATDGGEGGATMTGRKCPWVSERMRGNKFRVGLKPNINREAIAEGNRRRWAADKAAGKPARLKSHGKEARLKVGRAHSRFSRDEALAIIARIEGGETQAAIAREKEVTLQCINRIWRGTSYVAQLQGE